MIEYDRKLQTVSAANQRRAGLRREEIGVVSSAPHGLVLRHAKQRRDKHDLIKQTAFAGVLRACILQVPAVTLHQRFLIRRQLCHFFRLTAVGEHIVGVQPKAPHEITHFILVAALEEVHILRGPVLISRIGIQGHNPSVPFRPDAQVECDS